LANFLVTRASHVVVVPSFLLTVRALTRATLFPYTTLFRSHQRDGRFGHGPVAMHDAIPGILPALIGKPSLRTAAVFNEAVAIEIDRKSTRLNSSHVAISYAAFCLKKKKKLHPTPIPQLHLS